MIQSRRVDYIDYYRGDTIAARTFTIAEDGSPVDLAGVAISIRFRNGSQVVSKSIGSGVTVTDEPGGVFRLEPFALTESGAWRYDVQLEYPDGTILTIVWGYIEIVDDV